MKWSKEQKAKVVSKISSFLIKALSGTLYMTSLGVVKQPLAVTNRPNGPFHLPLFRLGVILACLGTFHPNLAGKKKEKRKKAAQRQQQQAIKYRFQIRIREDCIVGAGFSLTRELVLKVTSHKACYSSLGSAYPMW